VLWGAAIFAQAGGGVPEKRPSEGRGEDAADSYRRAGPYLDASWQLGGSVALWTLIGWFADRKLQTTPWLLVSGAVLGTCLGFYLFFKAVLAIGRKK
jgi:ATP synthase protein I